MLRLCYMKKADIHKEIFLKKSKLRQEVYIQLDKLKTATDIAKALKKHRSSVSRVLLDMEKRGYIECVNAKDNSFRHYVKKD